MVGLFIINSSLDNISSCFLELITSFFIKLLIKSIVLIQFSLSVQGLTANKNILKILALEMSRLRGFFRRIYVLNREGIFISTCISGIQLDSLNICLKISCAF